MLVTMYVEDMERVLCFVLPPYHLWMAEKDDTFFVMRMSKHFSSSPEKIS